MATEQEIKLALPVASVDTACTVLTALTGGPGRALALANLYFDTPERLLAGARGALRLRKTPQGWLQTFKSGGRAQAGLHSRHEWEMPVAGEALELEPLLRACGDSGHGTVAATLRAAWPALQPLFRTDFTRTLWHWHGGENAPGNASAFTGVVAPADSRAAATIATDSEIDIEIALDRGEVSAEIGGVRRSTALHELELELKRGPASALQPLAEKLMAAIPGLAPDDVSKAERGYRLLASLHD